jgi:hypothetical protein
METHGWYSQISHPSCCFLHREQFIFEEHPRKPTIWNAWFQQWNTGEEVLWWFGQQYCSILLVPLLTFMAELLQWSTWTGWAIRCTPWSKHYFQTTMQFFKTQCLHSHSWNCSFMVIRAWRWTSASSLASTITRLEHHWTTLVSFGDLSEEQPCSVGPLSPQHGSPSGFGWRTCPPGIEGSCEYIE